jgi:hypothetical protein
MVLAGAFWVDRGSFICGAGGERLDRWLFLWFGVQRFSNTEKSFADLI